MRMLWSHLWQMLDARSWITDWFLTFYPVSSIQNPVSISWRLKSPLGKQKIGDPKNIILKSIEGTGIDILISCPLSIYQYPSPISTTISNQPIDSWRCGWSGTLRLSPTRKAKETLCVQCLRHIVKINPKGKEDNDEQVLPLMCSSTGNARLQRASWKLLQVLHWRKRKCQITRGSSKRNSRVVERLATKPRWWESSCTGCALYESDACLGQVRAPPEKLGSVSRWVLQEIRQRISKWQRNWDKLEKETNPTWEYYKSIIFVIIREGNDLWLEGLNRQNSNIFVKSWSQDSYLDNKWSSSWTCDSCKLAKWDLSSRYLVLFGKGWSLHHWRFWACTPFLQQSVAQALKRKRLVNRSRIGGKGDGGKGDGGKGDADKKINWHKKSDVANRFYAKISSTWRSRCFASHHNPGDRASQDIPKL